jgi:hypothetical protein
MHGFSSEKNFSSRLNIAALREMGLEPIDQKEDDVDDEKEDDEKYDHGQCTFFLGLGCGGGAGLMV